MSKSQNDSSRVIAEIKAKLQTVLSKSVFNLWIKPLDWNLQDTTLTLTASDRFFKTYVKDHFLGIVTAEAQKVFADAEIILIDGQVIEGSSAPDKKPMPIRLPGMRPKNKAQFFRPDWTFDRFVRGLCNEEAHSACSDSANGTLGENILFIDATTGLGKSHLVQALGHAAQSVRKQRVKYITANRFSEEMIDALKDNTIDHFKKKYRDLYDVLIVENIPTLKTKLKTLTEFSEIVDHFTKTGKSLITTSTVSLKELEQSTFDSQLLSLLGSGLVTSINYPTHETRIGIIKQLSTLKGVTIPEGLVILIAQHTFRDVRKLERLITSICYNTTRQGFKVASEDIVLEKLEAIASITPQFNTTMLRHIIAVEFSVSEKDLRSRSRKKRVTFPRQMAMYIARKYTDESLSDIGSCFNRDHATVFHSIKAISSLLLHDTSIQGQLKMLEKKLRKGGFID